jgi:hypothetical protein
MRLLHSTRTVEIPEGVSVEVKARKVRVKGPRGVLERDMKHLAIDMFLIEEEGKKVGGEGEGRTRVGAAGRAGAAADPPSRRRSPAPARREGVRQAQAARRHPHRLVARLQPDQGRDQG